MKDSLNVLWGDDLVGHLDSVGRRDMAFRYAPGWLASPRARPISLSLPLREAPYAGEVAGAWFANLLPEGEVRAHVARKFGVSERNDFALLGCIGGDCAGALRLLPDPVIEVQAGELAPLPWAVLEARIKATPRPSLLALVMQDRELRLSLAGAQDKLPVHLEGDVLSLPRGAAASTHLLKVGGDDFPDLIQNEFFCLMLAREAGLSVPAARLAATKIPILVVERYDRRRDPGGVVRRLHQEDFCQALGLPPHLKYENEGGPPLARLFEVVAAGSRAPLPDKRSLLKWVLFNVLIGNADAHAKNLSLVHDDPDAARPRLAPFYDLVCTAAYEHLSDRHAQKIGGEYRLRQLRRRHWERLALDIDVNPGYLRSVAVELSGQLVTLAENLAGPLGREYGGATTLDHIALAIAKRAERLHGELTA